MGTLSADYPTLRSAARQLLDEVEALVGLSGAQVVDKLRLALSRPAFGAWNVTVRSARTAFPSTTLTCKPRARKKRRTGPGAGEQKRPTAQYPMHVVSFDFQSGVTTCGRHIRFFVCLDEYIPTALAIIPRRSFKAADVVAVLENIIAETGTAPAYVRCGNGPKFTAAALIDWCNTAGVDTAFIAPGSSWQNGFIESFNAQFRREQLAGEIMDTMAEARYLAEEWKAIYNHEWRHGSLAGMAPNRCWEHGRKEQISYRIGAGLLMGAQPVPPLRGREYSDSVYTRSQRLGVVETALRRCAVQQRGDSSAKSGRAYSFCARVTEHFVRVYSGP